MNFIKGAIMLIKRILSVLLLISLLLSLLSCDIKLLRVPNENGGEENGSEQGEKIEPKNRVFYEYFDTVSVIYDYSGSKNEDFSALCTEIGELLHRYHRLYDIYNEYEGMTNIATLNRMAGKGPVKVSEEIIDLLSFSIEMHRKTGGAVNVAMGAVLSLWHELRERGERIPTAAELSERGAHISIENLVVDAENSTVEILDPRASIDVGAVAKGFVAERLYEFFVSRGLFGYAISLGGNLRTVGTKPSGEGWVSGIKSPSGDGYIRTLEIADSSLVTSGSYERFYDVDGVRYHHIIDPVSLMPKNYYHSLSVYTRDSAVADALSTALFNMEGERIEAVLENFPDVEVTVLTADGQMRIYGSRASKT